MWVVGWLLFFDTEFSISRPQSPTWLSKVESSSLSHLSQKVPVHPPAIPPTSSNRDHHNFSITEDVIIPMFIDNNMNLPFAHLVVLDAFQWDWPVWRDVSYPFKQLAFTTHSLFLTSPLPILSLLLLLIIVQHDRSDRKKKCYYYAIKLAASGCFLCHQTVSARLVLSYHCLMFLVILL